MATQLDMFEDYILTELTNRVVLVNDVPTNSLLIRDTNAQGTKSITGVELTNDKSIANINGTVQSVPYSHNKTVKYENPIPNTVWNIQHNMSTLDVSVDVYNTSNNKIIPDSVVVIDPNTVEIVFLQDTTGKAIITGLI